MVYIIAYRLRRKNARRKVYAKIHSANDASAVETFNGYCENRMNTDEKPKDWELLTGDWKHITYYKGNENVY